MGDIIPFKGRKNIADAVTVQQDYETIVIDFRIGPIIAAVHDVEAAFNILRMVHAFYPDSKEAQLQAISVGNFLDVFNNLESTYREGRSWNNLLYAEKKYLESLNTRTQEAAVFVIGKYSYADTLGAP